MSKLHSSASQSLFDFQCNFRTFTIHSQCRSIRNVITTVYPSGMQIKYRLVMKYLFIKMTIYLQKKSLIYLTSHCKVNVLYFYTFNIHYIYYSLYFLKFLKISTASLIHLYHTFSVYILC